MNMNLGEFIGLISTASPMVIVAVMYFLTVRQRDRSNMALLKRIDEMLQQQQRVTDKLFVVMEQDTKYKEILTGILTTIEVKLDSARMK